MRKIYFLLLFLILLPYGMKAQDNDDLTNKEDNFAFDLTMKKDGEETTTFTYGNTITIEGSVKVAESTVNTLALEQDVVQLYCGETPLDQAVNVEDGFFTLTYDTGEKGIPIGYQTLTVKYGGSDELAVLGIVMTISFILQHLFAGIGQAVQPIASTNYGAGKTDRVWQSYRYLIWTAFIFGLVSTAACELFPLPLINLFVDASENVLEIGPHIVRVYSASLFFMSLNINIVFFLQSILIPVPSLIISLARGLVLSGILLIILPLFTGFDGILYALVLAEVLCTLFALPYMMYIRHKAVRSTVSARI